MHECEWQKVNRLLAVWVGQETDEQIQPALQALREGLPKTATTLLSSAPLPEVKVLLPLVNNLEHPDWQDVTEANSLIQTLKNCQFDAAIIFTQLTPLLSISGKKTLASNQSPYPLAYLCYLAEIPIRIGMSQEFGGGVLSHCINPPDDTAKVNPYLYLLKAAQFPLPNALTRLKVEG